MKPNSKPKDQPSTVSSRDKQAWSFQVPRPNFQRPRPTGRIKAIVVAAAFLLAVGAGYLGGLAGARQDSTIGGAGLSEQKKVVTSESQLISQIAKTLGPSVVSIDVVSQSSAGDNSQLQNLFGYGGGSQEQASAGTGIIIASDGLIITNRHVVPAGTTSVSVTLSDGTQLDNVKVVGRTKDTDSLDIAFLKIQNAKGHKLTPAAIGESSKVQVGDAVVAIGNALGQFQNTVTSGIISGFGRQVVAGDSSGDQSSAESLDDLFQTDAAINQGNSGGPLVNLNGQVIGINTAVASDSQNIGFAIPIDDVKGLISQVEKTGKLTRPYVGIRYTLLTADVAKRYDISVQNGALVIPGTEGSDSSVLSGSPADKAGIQAGDVITKIGSVTIDQNHSVTSAISKYNVGDKVDFTIIRDGKTIHKTVTLAAQPETTETGQ